MIARTRSRGFVLLPVVLVISLLGVVAYMLGNESVNTAAVGRNEAQRSADELLLSSALAHGRWLAMNNDCQMPATISGQSLGNQSYQLDFSGDPTQLQISATATNTQGEQISASGQSMPMYDYANPRMLDIVASADSYMKLESGKQWDTHGDVDKLHVNSESDKIERALFHFDLSSMPSNVMLQSGQMLLYLQNSGDENSVLKLHRISKSWSESAVSARLARSLLEPWSTVGGDYEATVAGSFIAGTVGHKSVAVDDMVAAWLEDSSANHGVVLALQPTADKKHFQIFSREAADLDMKPKLRVRYVCPCGTPCNQGLVLEDFVLSTENNATLEGLNFTAEDLVFLDRSVNTASVELEGAALGITESIRGVHKLLNGRYLLGFKNSLTIDAQNFTKFDVAEYNPDSGSFRKIFDGAAAGLSKEISSIAWTADNKLVLSLQGTDTVYGNSFDNTDLFWVDIDAAASGLFFSGAAFGLDQEITASHIRDNGNLILAFKGDTTLSGVDIFKGSLAEFDVGDNSAEVYYNSNDLVGATVIRSLHVGAAYGSLYSMDMHFDFENDLSPQALDVIGGRRAELLGTPSPGWVPGGLNGAMRFHNGGDYLWLSDTEAPNLDGSFSYLMWIVNEASDLSGGRIILNQSNVSSGKEFRIVLNNGNIAWQLVDGLENFTAGPFDKAEDSRWQHLAIVYDEEADTAYTYLDGELIASAATGFTALSNEEELRIGESWEGVMDEIRYYRHALGAKEINKLLETSPLEPDSFPAPAAMIDNAGSICNGAYADFFNSFSYSNSNGTLRWPESWTEPNESGSPTSGKVTISGSGSDKDLRLGINNGAIQRQIPTADWPNVTLSFDLVSNDIGDSGRHMSVLVSNTGPTGSWSEVTAFYDGDATGYYEFDISSFASNEAYIRFETSRWSGWFSSNSIKIDNVRVACQN